ncbi:unnamed protein product [Ectocarpus sp. CCAP 1310/34]|nr:unnamed protein product [Ectocarpus sp. CCAP 1310/34]
MSRLHNLLRKKKKPDKCGFCHAVIAKDETHSGVFYTVPEEEGGTIHQECWEKYHEKCSVKCLHCEGPVAHLPGRFNGKFYASIDPPGKIHSECWEAYKGSKPAAEKCGECGEPLSFVEGKFSGSYVTLGDGIKVHVECRSAYHQKHTEKCLQCNEPVAPEAGRFCGEFFEVEGNRRVHSECMDAYEETTAERCLVCKKAVRRMEGFSGDFMMIDGGKVHKECASEYQEMVADKCLHCQKGVRKAGEFSGSFYPVDRKLGDAEAEDNESKVHMECFEAYQAKLAEEGKGS